MIKLKPCPFCGGEAIILTEDYFYFSSTYKVVCLKCHSQSYYRHETREAAAKAWNTRYEPPTPGGAIVPAGNERLRG